MENFDYLEAVKRLEAIATPVEEPGTSPDDVGRLVKKSGALVEKCRAYLRGVREKGIGDEGEKDLSD